MLEWLLGRMSEPPTAEEEHEVDKRAAEIAERSVLSRAEADVMAWLETGRTPAETADAVGRSISTVNRRRQSIAEKLAAARWTVRELDDEIVLERYDGHRETAKRE